MTICSLTGFEPAPPAFMRACFRYTKPILRSIVPTNYSPCTAFFFGIVQRQLLTLCRCFRGAGYRNRTDIISPWRGDAIPLGESRIVITVGIEPTSFIPTRTNTLRIMTFRAYPYLHYRYATLPTSLSRNPPGHIAAVQRIS